MKLVEDTPYMRRLDQPSSSTYGSKAYVDCLLCGVPSDSEDETVPRKLTRKQARQGIRLDRLMIHYKGKHRDAFLAEGRTLFDMGFAAPRAVEATLVVEANDMPSEAEMETKEHIAVRTELPSSRLSAAPPMPTVIVEPARQPFWRALTKRMNS
jgi:hypothetical protein